MSSSIWWWLISGVRGDEQQASIASIFHLSISLCALRSPFFCSFLPIFLTSVFLIFIFIWQPCIRRFRRVPLITWAEDRHKVILSDIPHPHHYRAILFLKPLSLSLTLHFNTSIFYTGFATSLTYQHKLQFSTLAGNTSPSTAICVTEFRHCFPSLTNLVRLEMSVNFSQTNCTCGELPADSANLVWVGPDNQRTTCRSSFMMLMLWVYDANTWWGHMMMIWAYCAVKTWYMYDCVWSRKWRGYEW